MKKSEYIEDIVNSKWKVINDEIVVDKVEWDENLDKFRVYINNRTKVYTYERFFEKFILESNQKFWTVDDVLTEDKKFLSGWLCIINAISIFEKYGVLDASKVSGIIGHYVKDRVDDTHHAIKNNLQPPWMADGDQHESL